MSAATPLPDEEVAAPTDAPAPEPSRAVVAAAPRRALELKGVYDVPVRVSVILGRSKLEISQLLDIDAGTILQLDRQVGDSVDIMVNNRLIARGEIVLAENRIGVTMTEIINPEEDG